MRISVPILARFASESGKEPTEAHMKITNSKFNRAHILPTCCQYCRDEGKMVRPRLANHLRSEIANNAFMDGRPLSSGLGRMQHLRGNLLAQVFPCPPSIWVRLFSSHDYPSPANP